MNPLLPWILDFALEGAVLLAAAWVAVRALGRAPAALRHLIWAVAALGLVLVPLLDTALPGVGVPVLPPLAPVAATPAPAAPTLALAWIALLWLTGALLALLPSGLGVLRLRGLVRRARLRLVLLHELAHVKRRDWLVERGVRIALAFHWFNPLAWVAVRGLRRESERACDDAVLLAGECPADVAAPAMACPGRLEERIRAGLHRRVSRRVCRGVGLGTFALAISAVCLVGVLHVTERARAEEETPRYDIALDGKAAHETVQAAIDAAEPGAEIRIAPGTYDGKVVIRKPITLVGAGPEKTILTGKISYSKTARGAETSTDDRVDPVVLVVDTQDVILRELGLTGRSKRHLGACRADAVVLLRRAQAVFEHCAIRDSASCAAIVAAGSNALFHRCLVAAIAANGLVIHDAKAHIRNCDIRDCYHYGISIAKGSDVVVEGCRISGALWHGIRYDHCSPTIRGNAIFDNARSGIYASGRTAAVVEGNLFLRNILSGISCWFANEDVIRANTFVGTVREAVAVLGASRPLVEKNVFALGGVAVRGGGIGGSGEGRSFIGPLRLNGNWFWENEAVATVPTTEPRNKPGAPQPLTMETLAKTGNVEADPGFADADANDYGLAPDTPAGKAGAGVARPLSLESPWPLSEPEKKWRKSLAASRDELRPRRPSTSRAASPGRTAYAIAEEWIADLHSLTNAERRRKSTGKIRAALEGDDPLYHHAAFLAITRTGKVVWDKLSLRDLVLTRLATAEGGAQKSGFYALFNIEPRPEDLELLLTALEDPSPAMREGGSHLLHMFTKGQLDGKAAEALLHLLDTEQPRVLKEVMRGIWGARVSPEVEARLLEIAKTDDSDLYHDAIYFALSTLGNKSKAVVAELGRAAEKPDSNVSGRALWGLSYGVVPEAHEDAADLLLAVFERRSGGQDRGYCLRGLRDYGEKKHLEALERLQASNALDARSKRRLDATAQAIRNRLAREKNAGPGPVVGGRDPAMGNPWAQANAWIQAFQGAKGEEERRRARRRIQVALHSGDPSLQLAALCAYSQLWGDIPEAASDRRKIRALLSETPKLHYETALRALGRTGPEAEDVERLLAHTASLPPEHPRRKAQLIVEFVGRDVDGKAADAILALLDTDDGKQLEDVLIELQGIHAGPALEARLLELAKNADPKLYYRLIRSSLSRMKSMSPAVTREVLRATRCEDAPTRATAIYGLKKGEAAPSLHTKVADRMLEILETSSINDECTYAVWALAVYGDESHLPRLRTARERDDISTTLLQHVEGTIQTIEARGRE